MNKKLCIGTYQIHNNMAPILSEAWKKNCFKIDTAPNYREGKAQLEIGAIVLKAIREKVILNKETLIISSKVGFVDPNQKNNLLKKRVITRKNTFHNHNLEQKYINYQVERNLKELNVDFIETIFLHNPEIQLNYKTRTELYRTIYYAFEALEELANRGKIRKYGISSWNGFGNEKDDFQISNLYEIARTVGGSNHHFKCIQIPLNLVLYSPLKEYLFFGKGLLKDSIELSLELFANSPLYGGNLTKLQNPRIFTHINPNLTPAQICLLFSSSHQAISQVLTSPSNLIQLRDSLAINSIPPFNRDELRRIIEIIDVIR